MARTDYPKPKGAQEASGFDITALDEDVADQRAEAVQAGAEVGESLAEKVKRLEAELSSARRMAPGNAGRYLVAEVHLHPTKGDRLNWYPVEFVADDPRARDAIYQELHHNRKSPHGGRIRVVDAEEFASLAKILPRPWPVFTEARQAAAASMTDPAALDSVLRGQQPLGAW
jgi:hypothetical protein